MYRRLSRAAHRYDSDAGVGLILVIGLAGFMTILVTILVSITVNSLDASARHDNFDAAVATAESGIDQTLARLQRAYVDDGGKEFYTPSTGITGVDTTPVCNAAPIPNPGSFASATAEKQWALTQISTLLAAHPSCLQHAAHGDFVVIKPQGKLTIYAEGWSPSYGAKNARARLIKAEYLFVPYAPSNAILTGCSATIGDSTSVLVAPGVPAGLASIHSNCDLTTGSSCALQVSGQISMTGNYSGCAYPSPNGKIGGDGKVDQSPAQPVPNVTAYQIRDNLNPTQSTTAQQAAIYRSEWHDYCPNGTVHAIPAAAGDGTVDITPCAGPQIWPTSGGSANVCDISPDGFRYEGNDAINGATWTAVGQSGGASGVAPGIYYFNGGNVVPGDGTSPFNSTCSGGGLGNVSTSSATIIAAAVLPSGQPMTDFDPSVCTPHKIGGNIVWNHDSLGAPAIFNLFMFADADLSTSSAFQAGGAVGTNVQAGMFIAGDQVNMQTSSQGAYGAVIAEDQCPTNDPNKQNVINNPTIYYDPNAAAPFTSLIDTTLWLEFVGT